MAQNYKIFRIFAQSFGTKFEIKIDSASHLVKFAKTNVGCLSVRVFGRLAMPTRVQGWQSTFYKQ